MTLTKQQRKSIAIPLDIVQVVKGIQCKYCKCRYEKGNGFVLYTNYGNVIKMHEYCSKECRDSVHNAMGPGRSSINKKDLKLLRFW